MDISTIKRSYLIEDLSLLVKSFKKRIQLSCNDFIGNSEVSIMEKLLLDIDNVELDVKKMQELNQKKGENDG